ncbi:hypothetical protein [Actinomadura rupiterrae]|uniref:hypothetical protein n=1 Tax=Actinomadura rupiterrae TaxID=559627 RepID=UPI0020A59774|nr:hypothetical protein [Actinomadura rupiterrae]MCP2336517.1 hypothetical protein [Actinomadura rupiterrae]
MLSRIVNNADVGGRFCEDVTVGGVRRFLWSWGEAVAEVDEADVAGARVVHVMVMGQG